MNDDPSRRRLGRGLAALIGEMDKPAETAKVQPISDGRLPIAFISPNPRNPRRGFADADLADLAQSIREHGIVQPVVVRPTADPQRFELIADQKIKGLSHGQRVKACLLLVLARRPKLLVLDEPTTGLDPVARDEVITELADILRDDERSVLFSSHNTHDIEKLSDQIAFLDRGKLLALQDKESFVQSWSRFRCQLLPQALDSVAGAVSIRRSGQLAEVITDQSSGDFAVALQHAGFNVIEQHRMSLEDIFVANVKRNR